MPPCVSINRGRPEETDNSPFHPYDVQLYILLSFPGKNILSTTGIFSALVVLYAVSATISYFTTIFT